MTRTRLENLSFEDAICELCDEYDTIHGYEDLKDYVIDLLERDDLMVAAHVLKVLAQNSDVDFFDYDASMGLLEEVTPLRTTEDLVDYCSDEEDEGGIEE